MNHFRLANYLRLDNDRSWSIVLNRPAAIFILLLSKQQHGFHISDRYLTQLTCVSVVPSKNPCDYCSVGLACRDITIVNNKTFQKKCSIESWVGKHRYKNIYSYLYVNVCYHRLPDNRIHLCTFLTSRVIFSERIYTDAFDVTIEHLVYRNYCLLTDARQYNLVNLTNPLVRFFYRTICLTLFTSQYHNVSKRFIHFNYDILAVYTLYTMCIKVKSSFNLWQ